MMPAVEEEIAWRGLVEAQAALLMLKDALGKIEVANPWGRHTEADVAARYLECMQWWIDSVSMLVLGSPKLRELDLLLKYGRHDI